MITIITLLLWLTLLGLAAWRPHWCRRYGIWIASFGVLAALALSEFWRGVLLTAWSGADGLRLAGPEAAFLSVWVLVLLPIARRRLDPRALAATLWTGLIAAAALGVAFDVGHLSLGPLGSRESGRPRCRGAGAGQRRHSVSGRVCPVPLGRARPVSLGLSGLVRGAADHGAKRASGADVDRSWRGSWVLDGGGCVRRQRGAVPRFQLLNAQSPVVIKNSQNRNNESLWSPDSQPTRRFNPCLLPCGIEPWRAAPWR
jgi:hypothetical protein